MKAEEVFAEVVELVYPRIRAMREDSDLSQTQMAALLHISQATYSRYESGALDIPTQTLIALAQFYQASIDYLLGLTDRRVISESTSAI